MNKPNFKTINKTVATTEQIPVKRAYAADQIPQGQTREDIEQREKFIKDFYANWIAINPTKHIFNIASQPYKKRLTTLLVPEIVISR